jgi:hypothetical protein
MKTRWIACGLAFGVASLLVTGDACSQEAPGPDAEMEQMMKLWEKYALPGPPHKKLEVYAGTWDVTTKMWMEGPDAPPAVSKSTAWARPIFGGRFIETKAQGTMSFEYKGEVIQVPTEWVGYTGYDNFKEKYVGVWMQSSNTGIYHAEGTVDKTGKIFTYFGFFDEWETDRRGVPYKIVDRIVDENKIVSSMYDLTMKADEAKVFEMVLKRAVAKQPGSE